MTRIHIVCSATLLALAAACGVNATHPDVNAYVAAPEAPLPCVPNLDGRITADELVPLVGVGADFLTSAGGETRDIDLAGSVNSQGQRVWNWTAVLPTDGVVEITASALSDHWFAASFRGGETVLPVDAEGETLAVYAWDETALWLLGFASALEAPETLIVYESPIALYRFPLEVGAKWTASSLVRNATVRGLPYAAEDSYEVEVTAAGQLDLPDMTLSQTLATRVRTTIAPVLGGSLTTSQVSFLFECIGEAARATSLPNETAGDFTVAAEVRRLALGDSAGTIRRARERETR